MSTEVSVSGAMIDTRSELLYIDSRHHLPAVEKLSDFTTANNLSIKAHSPRDYSIRYEGYDDFSLAFEFEGLHEPWDIHDPSMNPLTHGTGTGGMGAAFGGHFEVSGHITGSMKLRGEEYAVDCVETMDHSWGHRPEVFMPTCGPDIEVVSPGDFRGQYAWVLGTIAELFRRAGARFPEDVVEVTVMVKDMNLLSANADVFTSAFGGVKPALTYVGVAQVFHPEQMIEIGATAYVGA